MFSVQSVRKVVIILCAAQSCVIRCGLGFREQEMAAEEVAEGTTMMSGLVPWAWLRLCLGCTLTLQTRKSKPPNPSTMRRTLWLIA